MLSENQQRHEENHEEIGSEADNFRDTTSPHTLAFLLGVAGLTLRDHSPITSLPWDYLTKNS